jgi:hypothetical protein
MMSYGSRKRIERGKKIIVLKSGLVWRVDPGPDSPGAGTGSSLRKNMVTSDSIGEC